MTTIPASQIVAVTPSVLAAGGNALDLNGLILTRNTRVPIGTVQSFPDAASVAAFFGSTSAQASDATIYFNGFDNSTAKPGALLFAQYPSSAVGAYLRGGKISTLTLAQLQVLSGDFGITIDGTPYTNASISLAAATSFTNAASIIGSALGIQGPQVASFTGSIAGGTLTVSAMSSGTLGVGDVLSGTGVTVGTYITGLLSGTGGVGTYSVSPSQNRGSQTITAYAPAVSYDSVSGAFVVVSPTTGNSSTISYGSGALATSVKLTQATGAVLSQGTGAVSSPSAFMDALIAITENWALFTTDFDPDATGNTNKLLFAAWTDGQNQDFGYVPWDTDASPTTTVPATSSLGYLISQAEYKGTSVIYSPDEKIAVFVLGIAASLDFEATNGRATFAFRTGTGLMATVTDSTIASNLLANGYNFYGAYATANDQFVFLYDGSISGSFLWLDSYVNQIWLNNAFQLALMTLLTQAFSIPYNAAGNAQIEAALADPIAAGLNFGAIRAGVTLSNSQKASINAAAGANVAPTIEQRGWYLQVLPASASVRQARQSPPCTFWYTDGQAVQKIDLSSIAIT